MIRMEGRFPYFDEFVATFVRFATLHESFCSSEIRIFEKEKGKKYREREREQDRKRVSVDEKHDLKWIQFGMTSCSVTQNRFSLCAFAIFPSTLRPPIHKHTSKREIHFQMNDENSLRSFFHFFSNEFIWSRFSSFGRRWHCWKRTPKSSRHEIRFPFVLILHFVNEMHGIFAAFVYFLLSWWKLFSNMFEWIRVSRASNEDKCHIWMCTKWICMHKLCNYFLSATSSSLRFIFPLVDDGRHVRRCGNSFLWLNVMCQVNSSVRLLWMCLRNEFKLSSCFLCKFHSRRRLLVLFVLREKSVSYRLCVCVTGTEIVCFDANKHFAIRTDFEFRMNEFSRRAEKSSSWANEIKKVRRLFDVLAVTQMLRCLWAKPKTMATHEIFGFETHDNAQNNVFSSCLGMKFVFLFVSQSKKSFDSGDIRSTLLPLLLLFVVDSRSSNRWHGTQLWDLAQVLFVSRHRQRQRVPKSKCKKLTRTDGMTNYKTTHCKDEKFSLNCFALVIRNKQEKKKQASKFTRLRSGKASTKTRNI